MSYHSIIYLFQFMNRTLPVYFWFQSHSVVIWSNVFHHKLLSWIRNVSTVEGKANLSIDFFSNATHHFGSFKEKKNITIVHISTNDISSTWFASLGINTGLVPSLNVSDILIISIVLSPTLQHQHAILAYVEDCYKESNAHYNLYNITEIYMHRHILSRTDEEEVFWKSSEL